jgi:hypothetical protein
MRCIVGRVGKALACPRGELVGTRRFAHPTLASRHHRHTLNSVRVEPVETHLRHMTHKQKTKWQSATRYPELSPEEAQVRADLLASIAQMVAGKAAARKRIKIKASHDAVGWAKR